MANGGIGDTQSAASGTPGPVGGSPVSASSAGVSRRRVVAAGLLGASLIVTLRARPAYGGDPSLGSLGIPYGMYDAEGKPINSQGKALDDPTRRSGQ